MFLTGFGQRTRENSSLFSAIFSAPFTAAGFKGAAVLSMQFLTWELRLPHTKPKYLDFPRLHMVLVQLLVTISSWVMWWTGSGCENTTERTAKGRTSRQIPPLLVGSLSSGLHHSDDNPAQIRLQPSEEWKKIGPGLSSVNNSYGLSCPMTFIYRRRRTKTAQQLLSTGPKETRRRGATRVRATCTRIRAGDTRQNGETANKTPDDEDCLWCAGSFIVDLRLMMNGIKRNLAY